METYNLMIEDRRNPLFIVAFDVTVNQLKNINTVIEATEVVRLENKIHLYSNSINLIEQLHFEMMITKGATKAVEQNFIYHVIKN